jgi:hypothetical protein
MRCILIRPAYLCSVTERQKLLSVGDENCQRNTKMETRLVNRLVTSENRQQAINTMSKSFFNLETKKSDQFQMKLLLVQTKDRLLLIQTKDRCPLIFDEIVSDSL